MSMVETGVIALSVKTYTRWGERRPRSVNVGAAVHSHPTADRQQAFTFGTSVPRQRSQRTLGVNCLGIA